MKVQTLPEYLKAELRKGQYCAVWAAGPVEVVAKRIGDNRGCRPVKFGITASWNDTVTPQLNAASYATRSEMLFRLWCANTGRAKTLVSLIDGEMSLAAVPMRVGWNDLGPELNLRRFEKSIRELARDFQIWTWSDDELHKLLREKHAAEKQRRVHALRRGAVF